MSVVEPLSLVSIYTESFETIPSWFGGKGTVVAGHTGNAVALAGSAGSVTYPIPVGSQSSDTTVDFWFMMSALPTVLTPIIDLCSPAGTLAGRIAYSASGYLVAYLHTAQGDVLINGLAGKPTFTINTWNRLTLHVIVDQGAGHGAVQASFNGTMFATATNYPLTASSPVVETMVLYGNGSGAATTAFDDLTMSVPFVDVASVSMTGETNAKFGDAGYVMMYLHGGPLDGEQQIVEGTVNVIGANIVINVPNYQSFASDGITLTALGLQVTYVVVSQGPGPNVAAGDTWDTSWNLNFVPGSYTPPIPPPFLGQPPVITPSPAIWMAVTSNLTVNADDPSPGVWMLDTESFLDIEADNQATGWASVSMEADTTLVPTVMDWSSYVVPLEGDTSLTVVATTYTYAVFMGASTGMTVTPS